MQTKRDPFVPCVGGVLSADIAVPEHEREVRFYSRVLGTGEDPLWREDLMNSRGMPVIGLGPRSAEYPDLPLQWMPHIQVADVAASARRAVELGGSELLHGKDDEGNSQWAVLLDSNGAAFGVIPVVPADAMPPTESGASLDPEAPVGCISWVELTVSDAEAASDFYRQVIGWSSQEIAGEDAEGGYVDIHMIGGDGEPAAGIRPARGSSVDLPSVWMLHLPVADLAESLRRVEEEGGKILQATRGTNGEHVSAVVQDPIGACLALVKA